MIKKKALFFKKNSDSSVECFLCSHRCIIGIGKRGICGVRVNVNGELETLVYGDLIARNVDPIEKKPLNHFLPGSFTYSIATVGCNFKCSFCQNWQISQFDPSQGTHGGFSMLPEHVVDEAIFNNCQSISYTYTEPTIFFEYAYDISRLAKEKKLANIFVTNGYMSRDALTMIHPYLDACNVDLKAFSEAFYRKFCKASLQPVLDSIKYMKELGIWVEITTLLIPHQNDSDEELQAIAHFIASIDTNMPWHISRYRPEYQYSESPPTPLKDLQRAAEIGRKEGLHYTYLGNVIEGNDTDCFSCQEKVIQRTGYVINNQLINESQCPHCRARIHGVYKAV
jgi:pyruvate formate lyase activating enzyme